MTAVNITAKIYPFTAIVGQDAMKRALILNSINPALGGVLIKGEKGTAKSTAVRALADLLPAMDAVTDCGFQCDPLDKGRYCGQCWEKVNAGQSLSADKRKMRVVDLPVSATEDRVVGTLDIEHALKMGQKKFEPGILAQANRNILYIDEINLLDDHVVDVLLDAAAMGVNTVEREGVSFVHPARFVLVGTMNPEEGDIRPQLLDRFGLSVEVVGEQCTQDRVEVIRRRLRYEQHPEVFRMEFDQEQQALAQKIITASSLLPMVQINDSLLELVANISIKLEVDGHRADITMIKTAMTLAAFAGRLQVVSEDIKEAAKLVLPHRMRRRPFEEGTLDWSVLDQLVPQV
jgi:magnesium chelatase subunit I